MVNERSLESIINPRLERLKEKTFRWKVKLVQIPGKKLGGPDDLSMVEQSSVAESAYINRMEIRYMSDANMDR